jgi:hypothetical protein
MLGWPNHPMGWLATPFGMVVVRPPPDGRLGVAEPPLGHPSIYIYIFLCGHFGNKKVKRVELSQFESLEEVKCHI